MRTIHVSYQFIRSYSIESFVHSITWCRSHCLGAYVWHASVTTTKILLALMVLFAHRMDVIRGTWDNRFHSHLVRFSYACVSWWIGNSLFSFFFWYGWFFFYSFSISHSGSLRLCVVMCACDVKFGAFFACPGYTLYGSIKPKSYVCYILIWPSNFQHIEHVFHFTHISRFRFGLRSFRKFSKMKLERPIETDQSDCVHYKTGSVHNSHTHTRMRITTEKEKNKKKRIETTEKCRTHRLNKALACWIGHWANIHWSFSTLVLSFIVYTDSFNAVFISLFLISLSHLSISSLYLLSLSLSLSPSPPLFSLYPFCSTIFYRPFNSFCNWIEFLSIDGIFFVHILFCLILLQFRQWCKYKISLSVRQPDKMLLSNAHRRLFQSQLIFGCGLRQKMTQSLHRVSCLNTHFIFFPHLFTFLRFGPIRLPIQCYRQFL